MRIVAVAIRVNGLIMSLPAPARHFHVIKAMPEKWARKCKPSEQGFLTDAGEFVGREDGLAIARAASQLKAETPHRELFGYSDMRVET